MSQILISWINYFTFSLGAIPIWPTKNQVRQSMPNSFKNTYPNTRCILDCTELLTALNPLSLKAQSSLYSFYKHHVTYKGLVGNSPPVALIFISQLYDGSISDKETVARSGIFNPRF